MRRSEPRVLLVDSDVDFLHRFADLLVASGYQVMGVSSSEEMCDWIERWNPDVIFLEADSPTCVCLREVGLRKKEGMAIPWVVVAADWSPSFSVEAQRQGASWCMAKPLDLEELFQVLERLAGKRPRPEAGQ